MATTVAELKAVLLGDASQFKREITSAIASIDQVQGKAQDFASKAQSLGKALSIGVTAPVVAFAAVGVKELIDSEKVAAQTAAVIKSTGQAANVTAKQVDTLAQSLLNKSGIDDETIKSGENLLLTFTNIRNAAGRGNDVFNQATKLSLDLSVAWGEDMHSAAIQLGKALQDPIQGVTALRRVGVQLSDAQQEQIKNFVAAGDVMSAQKVILSELRREVGGSAEAYGNTLAGQLSKAKEEFKNAAASIVSVFAPALHFAAEGAATLAGFLSGLSGGSRTAVAGLLAFGAALGPALIVVGKLTTSLAEGGTLRTGIETLSAGFVKLRGMIVNAAYAMAEMSIAALGPIAIFAGIVAGAVAVGYALSRVFGDGGAMGQAVAQIKRGEEEGKKFADTLVAGAKASENPLDVMRSRLEEARQKLAELQALASSGKFSPFGNQEDAAAAGRTLGTIKELKSAIAEYKQQQALAAAADQQRAADVQAVANGTTNLANATDAAKQAIQDFQSAELAARGGEIGRQQSLLNATKAQEDLNTAIREHGPFSAEAAAAALNLQQAQLGVQSATDSAVDAQQKYADQLKTNPALLQAEIVKIQDEINKYGDSTGALGLRLQALKDTQAFIDSMHGTQVDINIFAHDYASGVIAAVNYDIQNLGALGPVFAGLDMIPHAAGGVFTAPHVGLVAEAGPEAIVPLSNPSRAAQVMAQAGLVGGGGTTINIDIHGSVVTERQLAEVVADAINDPTSAIQIRGSQIIADR